MIQKYLGATTDYTVFENLVNGSIYETEVREETDPRKYKIVFVKNIKTDKCIACVPFKKDEWQTVKGVTQ